MKPSIMNSQLLCARHMFRDKIKKAAIKATFNGNGFFCLMTIKLMHLLSSVPTIYDQAISCHV